MNYRRFVVPVGIVVIWAAMSGLGAFNPMLIPSPAAVAKIGLRATFWGEIGGDAGASILRLVSGFALGAFLGIVSGVAMGRSTRVYETLEFLVDFFRSIPVAALFPLFLVLFGIGNMSKIATTAWSSSLVVLVNTMYGVRACSPTRERYARTLGATRFQILKSVVLPESLPSIFAGLRTGISIALIVVVLTEMFFGTSSGLGHRIFNAALLYEIPELYCTIALTGILGYAVNQGFVLLERRTLRWTYLATN
jgi:ABC-type nitrate/sulfonate/bicarbonate transport system permease component